MRTNCPDCGILLLGNKCDLKEQRCVSIDEINEIKSYLNLEYFDVSAKSGENLEVAFLTLVKKAFPELFPPSEIVKVKHKRKCIIM